MIWIYIVNGTRPKVVSGTPLKKYKELMEQRWNASTTKDLTLYN
jgi:hypothetical protein